MRANLSTVPFGGVSPALVRNALSIVCLGSLLGVFGCATAGGGGSEPSRDLVRTEVDMPGTLYVREGHGIGSYDAFLIPPAALGYRRGSAPLPDALAESFKAQLEQTLLDATRAAEIPTVSAPGACVMVVALGVLEVDVASRDSADPAGELTMAMEFRDSLSGDALLRYEAPQTIANDGSGDPPAEQIMRRFDAMVRDMQLAGALRAAGLAEEATRPECDGLLAKRGQALSSPAVASGPPDFGEAASGGQ